MITMGKTKIKEQMKEYMQIPEQIYGFVQQQQQT